MSYLAIQVIQIQYTDDQRGRVDAEKRESIRALPLAASAGDGVLHDCRVSASANSEPKTMTSAVPIRDGEVLIENALRLRVEDAALVFVLDAGADVWKSKQLFALAEGQWARVIWNAKRATHDAKWLVEFVVNAGLFAGPPAGEVFLGTPTNERDLRRDFLRNAYR
jgi:hypothetical protein